MAGCQENPTRTKRNVRNTATAIGREEAESEPGPLHLFPTCPQPVSEDRPSDIPRASSFGQQSGSHWQCSQREARELLRPAPQSDFLNQEKQLSKLMVAYALTNVRWLDGF